MQGNNEVFVTQPTDLRQLKHNALQAKLDAVVQLGALGSVVDESAWRTVEDEAYSAIHEYADVYGVAVDEEGMAFRRDFATALNTRLRIGINPLKSQMIDDPATFTEHARRKGLLSDPANAIPDNVVVRFDRAVDGVDEVGLFGRRSATGAVDTGSGLFNAVGPLTGAEHSMQATHSQTIRQKLGTFVSNIWTERNVSSRQDKIKGYVVKGIAAVALAGVAVFGVAKCSDTVEMKSSEEGIATISTVPSTTEPDWQIDLPTTTTSILSEVIPNSPVSSSDIMTEGQIETLTPAPAEMIDSVSVMIIPEGSSVWRELKKSYSQPGICDEEMDMRILAALPSLRRDNTHISNLSEINIGQAITIGPEAMSILAGARA